MQAERSAGQRAWVTTFQKFRGVGASTPATCLDEHKFTHCHPHAPQVSLDPRRFVGIESVPGAVEWLYSGQSVGKVVVQLARDMPPAAPSRL